MSIDDRLASPKGLRSKPHFNNLRDTALHMRDNLNCRVRDTLSHLCDDYYQVRDNHHHLRDQKLHPRDYFMSIRPY